ncbi:hypothetical protein LJR231_000471 [Phyllobacterium sp. LjRoot231]
MRRSEITFGDNPQWLIPRWRTKNGLENLIPLTPAIVEILEGLEQHVRNGLYFKSERGKGIVAGFPGSKRRLDATTRRLLLQQERDPYVEPWTIHDLRATMYSGLSRLKVPRHIAELLVNHRPKNKMRMAIVYDRYDYLDEKREAMNKWSGYVQELVANVVFRESEIVN